MPKKPADRNASRGPRNLGRELVATSPPSSSGTGELPAHVGPYRVVCELGRGAMGIVYLAVDAILQRQIAVKVLAPTLAGDPGALVRFAREAHLLAALSHPNIAVIHALDESDEGLFLAMEFVPGENLSDRLLRERMTIEDSLRIARQIAAALEAAHEKGVVHRDLKPGNVRIRPDGRVSLLDFGLAMVEGSPQTHRAGAPAPRLVGTLGYMSPEQVLGETIDHRADMWAFGCLVYECLAGSRAFAATTRAGLIAATLDQEPDWTRLPTETPEAVRQLLGECLQKSPDKRLDRAAVARRVIEEALAPGSRTMDWGAGSIDGEGKSHLPRQLTTFVGRQAERATLRQRLGTSRLVTLTGAGGTGKSRLALEVAAEVSEGFEDGVHWVELATLADPSLVPRTVASALHLRERTGWSASDVVIDHLQDKTLLLVLDNCEHLLAACSTFAAALLSATPGVRILATSREPLGIGGERVHPLQPLAVPPAGDATSLEAICNVDSVRLFEDRAQAVAPDFQITAENATAVSEICRRVDGIPLALELAATRVRVLSPAEIVEHLDACLISRDRTALPRHRTMTDLINWSCDLLSTQERTVLRRLSIFSGGWTLEAAEAVCSDGTVSKWEFLGLFTRLVEQSLVERDHSKEARQPVARYRFLEPVRQQVLEQLQRAGEHTESRRRHRSYFLTLAESAETELRGPKQAYWLDRLEIEHDNLRAALEPLPQDPDDVRSRLRLVVALGRFWFLRGFITEGAHRCDQAVSDQTARQYTELWARVWAWKVWLLTWHGDLPAARAAAEQACAVCRSEGHQRLMVFALNALASVEEHSGNLERAESVYGEARALSLRLADDHALLLPTTANLAELVWRRGDYRRAFALAREAHVGMGASAAPFDRAENLRNLARPALKLGKRRAARRWLQESLRVSRAIEDRWGMASSLELLAALDAELGQPKRATRLLAAADLLRSQVETPISPADLAQIRKYIDDVKGMLGKGAFEEAWAEGRAMALGEVIEEARQRHGRNGGGRYEEDPCPSHRP